MEVKSNRSLRERAVIYRDWGGKPRFIRSKRKIKENGHSEESVNSQDRETHSLVRVLL